MKKKNVCALIPLAITAFLLAGSAGAAPESITECVPMVQLDGKVTIYAVCNAAAVNEKYNLRRGEASACAAENQPVSLNGAAGLSRRQGSITRWVGENSAPALRDCADEEVIAVEPRA